MGPCIFLLRGLRAIFDVVYIHTVNARCRPGTVDDCQGRQSRRPRQVPGRHAVIVE
jgi:hypothetical protein